GHTKIRAAGAAGQTGVVTTHQRLTSWQNQNSDKMNKGLSTRAEGPRNRNGGKEGWRTGRGTVATCRCHLLVKAPAQRRREHINKSKAAANQVPAPAADNKKTSRPGARRSGAFRQGFGLRCGAIKCAPAQNIGKTRFFP